MKRVILTEAAKADLRSNPRHYNRVQPGLGHRFFRTVGEAILLLGENPEAMEAKNFQVRRRPISGFPYGLMYRIRGEEVIVLAVSHPKQHPSAWQDRAI